MPLDDEAIGELEVSRRTVLKTAAVGGLGLVVGDTLLGRSSLGTQATGSAAMQVETVEANAAWFSERIWAISGNKVVTKAGEAIPRTESAVGLH